jgi:hypothetical protein
MLAVTVVPAGFLRPPLQVLRWAFEYRDYTGVVLNLGTFLLALPLHVVFLRYLWDQKPQPVLVLVALGVLAVLALLLTQTDPIRFLAGGGLVMALLQYFSMRHMKRVGMKVI